MPTKQCTKCKEIKELDQYRRMKSAKDGHHPSCKSCDREYRFKTKERDSIKRKKCYIENREKILIERKIYQELHKEELAIKRKAKKEETALKQLINRILNGDERRKYEAEWRLKNKDKTAKILHRYAQNNPGKMNAKTSKRRAAKRNATPPWLTDEHWEQIEAFYIEAARLTKETGIKHEVDHIHPLKGKNLSGLHVPWNLQILTQSENAKKGNRIS